MGLQDETWADEITRPFQSRVPKLVSVDKVVPSTRPAPPTFLDAPAINLLASLPPDVWDRLSPDEKQELMTDLPPLDGWWGLSGDDAATENVRQLFHGLNFNFGNPLMQFHFPSAERRTKREAEKAAFDARLRVYTKQLLQSIVQSRTQVLQQVLPADELALNPELDIAAVPRKKEAIDDIDHSFFLAIRAALLSNEDKSNGHSLSDLLIHVQTYAPLSIPPPAERPPNMQLGEYLHSALIFLARPFGLTDVDDTCDDDGWSTPFVHVVDEAFAWQESHREAKTTDAASSVLSDHDVALRLLYLERLFRAPFTHQDSSMAPLQSKLELVRKRMQAQDTSDHADRRAKQPKLAVFPFALKQAHMPLHGQYTMTRDAFHQQEMTRYQHPHQSFIYFDTDSNFQCLVGPCFPPTLTSPDQAILLAEVAPQVTVLGVIRDAVARLPLQCGTRADVLALLRMSMYALVFLVRPSHHHVRFVNPAASLDELDSAVARGLDTLATMMHPCVYYRFHTDHSAWLWHYVPPPTART
ncbi:Aste57867_24335 [Aphanomyces stellatus]|uniref:Aste57867_24335 protein n=1 Tax=Aphanomyces stellatus TaxID=120398 RepID=A0A485LQD7_9STRA|nr:hypothetical protein As57867_024260 [Aphanomyces stellatus]VFU00975.1 Aste57867_24335 [Aphanomyces stellatus]